MKIMLRGIAALAVLAGLLACPLEIQAQTAADIASEPHHRLLLENAQVRVFEVSLRPTEKAFVKHDHNFLAVTLTDSEMVMWAQGQADIQNFRFNRGDVRFFFSGPPRGLRNDRTTPYRNVTVEFLNPKVTTYGYQPTTGGWDYGGSTLNAPVDPQAKFSSQLNLGEATAIDVQLLQGDAYEPPEKPAAELLIPVTDVSLRAESDNHIRKSSGDVVWIPAGRKFKLMNTDSQPARFVVVELR